MDAPTIEGLTNQEIKQIISSNESFRRKIKEFGITIKSQELVNYPVKLTNTPKKLKNIDNDI